MPQIGPLEVLMFGMIALIVFGPRRLPEIARSIGKSLAELRKQARDIRAEFEEGLDADDPPDKPVDEPADKPEAL
jgi:sec-independent protein translocase protein TatA